MTGPHTSSRDAGWVLQWWQAKAATTAAPTEQLAGDPGGWAIVDADVVAAPTVVRLLAARDSWELAHEAAAAWSLVEALDRAGSPPRILGRVAVRFAVAFTHRLHELGTELAHQSGDHPDTIPSARPSPRFRGQPPPG